MYLYTNNEVTEKEIKNKNNNKTSFTIAPERIQYLGINLSKEVKDLAL